MLCAVIWPAVPSAVADLRKPLWLALALAVSVAAQGARQATPGLAERLAELDAGAPARRAAALEELARLGPAAAAAAVDLPLEQWWALPVQARRARVELFLRAAGAEDLERVRDRIEDPDPALAERWTDFLAAPRLRSERAQQRAELLEQLARGASDAEVRAAAVRALSRIEAGPARDALERLIDSAGEKERVLAARALARSTREPERIVRQVVAQLKHGGSALTELVRHGLADALARTPAGGETKADRELLATLVAHPDPALAAAARQVLIELAERCAQRSEPERAERVLHAALDCGFDAFELLACRARLGIQNGAAASAGDAAREIVRRHPASGSFAVRLRRAMGRMLEGGARLAQADPAAALEALRGADALLGALTREAAGTARVEAGGVELEALTLRAVCAAHLVLAQLCAGRGDDDLRTLEAARELDLRLLTIRQALARRADVRLGERDASLDDVSAHAYGPGSLFFASRVATGYSRERWLELEGAWHQALANVTRGLVPGFEGKALFDARFADPLADDERRTALEQLRLARFEALNAALARRVERLQRDVQDAGAEATELIEMLGWQRVLAQRQQEELDKPSESLLLQREFSRAPLLYIERLRDNGRSGAARKLAERAVVDIGALRGALDDYQFELALSRAESALGGVLMDQDEPAGAEQTLTKSLDRLRALEQRLEADGRSAGRELVRSATAGVLVSLAINANVKANNPARAVEYFERAYELDQSDFMRVLLACYRARAGRMDEARAILRETPIEPANYYNAACTHALLGETELALDYLARDFRELRTSAGARQRQQEWARKDPDLAALRGDPRFEALVRSESDEQPAEQKR